MTDPRVARLHGSPARPAGKLDHPVDRQVMSDESAFAEQQAADDLAWASITTRKHTRHDWILVRPTDEGYELGHRRRCVVCQRFQDEAKSRQGRLNRSRGNAIERWVCKLLGIARVGQYGGLEDGGAADDWLRIQVKSGGAHQAALLAKIHTIPANAAQLRGWVTVSTPGAGHPREGVISFDLREFAAWYGKGIDEGEAA
jgi:hypothetical protein